MNKVYAMAIVNEIDKLCNFQLQRYYPPQICPLKDFGIDEEGYCIFCEDFRTYKSRIQTCIIAFMKLQRMQKVDIGNDAIIFEEEITYPSDPR